MCGRYDLSESPAAIQAHFNVPSVAPFSPSHDVRPTEHAPIIRINPLSMKRESTVARWGLVPSWAKDLKFGARCINARIETLESVAAYRAAYRNRRCLVPASAFFEWSGPSGRRTKWRIRPWDQPLFGLAGLWERWIDPHSGQPVETYAIVTTPANRPWPGSYRPTAVPHPASPSSSLPIFKLASSAAVNMPAAALTDPAPFRSNIDRSGSFGKESACAAMCT